MPRVPLVARHDIIKRSHLTENQAKVAQYDKFGRLSESYGSPIYRSGLNQAKVARAVYPTRLPLSPQSQKKR